MTDENVVEKAEREQVHRLLAELRHGPIPLAGSAERAAQRQRLLPALREQVRTMPLARRRKRRIRQLTSLAVAAGLIGGGLSLWRVSPRGSDEAAVAELSLDPRGGEVSHTRPGFAHVVETATTIAANGTLEAFQAASLTTKGGVRMELAERTRVALDGLTQKKGNVALRLLQGRVDCTVPALGTERRFSVITPSAEIIVHGTRFSVSTHSSDTAAGAAPHAGGEVGTCVRVIEGRVEVLSAQGRRFLTDGEQWGCEMSETTEQDAREREGVHEIYEVNRPAVGTAADDTAVDRAAVDRATQVNGTGSNSAGSRRLGASKSALRHKPAIGEKPKVAAEPLQAESANLGTLEQETQLFARALAAERRGDRIAARASYAELLRRYPQSPLAPEAKKGHQRLE